MPDYHAIFDQRRHLLREGALAHVAKRRRRCGANGPMKAGKRGMMRNYGMIGWIVIGLLAGAIAKLLMPGKDPGGCIITILLGIAGALLAGFLGKSIGWYQDGEAAGFIAAIVGAFLILLIYRLIVPPPPLGAPLTFSVKPSRRSQAAARCRSILGETDEPFDFAAAAGAAARRLPPLPTAAWRRTAPLVRPIAGTRLDISATGEVTPRPRPGDHLGRRGDASATTATAAIAGECRRAWSGSARRCKRAGIADRDIQTSSINLNPEYRYENNQPPLLTGYQASNKVIDQVPRHPQQRQDPRCAGGRGRQPDQRPEPDHRQARGGALTRPAPRRSPPAARAPTSMRARWACGSCGCCRSAKAAAMRPPPPMPMHDGHAEPADAKTKIDPGEPGAAGQRWR